MRLYCIWSATNRCRCSVFGDPLAVGEAVRRVVARAEVEDLARPHEIVERAEGLLLRRVDVLHVDLVEVDAIRPEATQAVLHRPDDAVPGGARRVRPLAHAEAKLGREDDAVTAPRVRHPRAHDALGEPVLTVDVGGVDEAHAAFERAAHDRKRRLLVAPDLVHERLVVRLPEGHGAEAEHGDPEPTVS